MNMLCDVCELTLPFNEYVENKSVEATSNDDGRKVNISGIMPKDTEASLSKVADVEALNLAKKFKRDIAKEEVISAYDISLNSNSMEYQPGEYSQFVNVRLSNLKLDTSKDYALLHIIDENNYEIIPANVLNSKTIEFKATRFSVYILITVNTYEVTFTGENYKVYDTEGYEITSGDEIIEGTNFNFTIVPNDGYGVTSVTSTGTTITTTGYAKGKACNIENVTGALTIDVVTEPAPVITTQPVSAKVKDGTTATFTMTATNATTYQWQYRENASGEWQDVTDALGTNYDTATFTTLSTSYAWSGYQFRCLVGNDSFTGDHRVKSDIAVLSVAQDEISAQVDYAEIEITTHPVSQKVKIGDTAIFTIVATGADTYKWQYMPSGETTWYDVDDTFGEGYDTDTLKVSTINMSINEDLTLENSLSGYSFRCVVSNSSSPGYTVNSDIAILSVAQDEINVDTTIPNYSVNGAYYATLADAYAAITDTTGTIIVEQDVTDDSTFTVDSDKTITLDLNGKTITKSTSSITNDGNLVISGEGTLNVTTGTIVNNGTLTIGNNDGTINKTAPVIVSDTYAIENNDGTVNYYDGTLKGIEEAYSGDISNTPVGYAEYIGTETIDSKVYKTAVLRPILMQRDQFIEDYDGVTELKDNQTLASGEPKIINYYAHGSYSRLGSTDYTSEKVVKVEIIDTTTGTAPTTFDDEWDVSQAQDGSIMARIQETTSGSGIYNLYIISDGAIFTPEWSHALFGHYPNVTTITGLENLDTSNTTDMGHMFSNDKSLTAVNVSTFNTSNVTDMSQMFGNCSALTSLDVSAWNTSKVTDFQNTFLDCSGLTTLTVTGLETDAATIMSSMFNGCSNVSEIDVTGFNTENVEDFSMMFANCTNLTTLEVGGFDTSKAKVMAMMFNGCSFITELNVANFDLTSLDGETYTSTFNGENAVDTMAMFGDCSSLETLDVSTWDTSKITRADYMFYNCIKVEELDVSNWNTSNMTSMEAMFYSCNALERMDLSNWNTANATNMDNMFMNCAGLKSILLGPNVSKFNGEYIIGGAWSLGALITQSATPIEFTTGSWMASSALYVLDETVQEVFAADENISGKFSSIKPILELVGSAEVSVIFGKEYTDQGASVAGFTADESIEYTDYGYTLSGPVVTKDGATVDPFTTTEAGTYLFTYTLTYKDGSTIAPVSVSRTVIVADLVPYLMARESTSTAIGATRENMTTYTAASINKIIIQNTMTAPAGYQDSWDVSLHENNGVMAWTVKDGDKYNLYIGAEGKVIASSAVELFKNYTNVTEITGLENLDLSEITNMTSMFEYMEKLTTINLSSFKTSDVTNMSYMFNGAKALEELDVTSFDTSSVRSMQSMFAECTNLKDLDLSNFTVLSNATMTKMFYNDSSLESILLGKGVSKLDGTNMFTGCTGLKAVITQNGGAVAESGTKLGDLLQVGDYVSYTGNGSYLLDSTLTGYSSTSGTTLTSESATWRVWDIEEDGTVVIMPTEPVNEVHLSGGTGWLNADKIIDGVCQIYTNSSLGVTAEDIESLRIEDLEERSSTIVSRRDAFQSTSPYPAYRETNYEHWKTYYTSGTFYAKYNSLTEKNEVLTTPITASSSNNIELLQTAYFVNTPTWNNITNTNFSGLTYGDLLGTTYAWLASPCIYLYSSYANFEVHVASSNGVNYDDLYNSNGGTSSLSLEVRPLVSLSPDLQIDTTAGEKNGSSESVAWVLTKGAASSEVDGSTLMTITNTTGINALPNPVLYVPSSEAETAYESAANYSTAFGIGRIRPILELVDDEEVNIPVGGSYDEGATVAGYTEDVAASYEQYGYELSEPVITKDGAIVSSVDTSNAGTYELTYTLDYTDLHPMGDETSAVQEVMEVTQTVNILPTDISEANTNITASIPAGEIIYNGLGQTPTVTVKDGNNVLDADDYDVAYTNNINAGNTATITITGKGNYTGTRTLTFKISPKPIQVTWDSEVSFIFDGTAKAPTVTTPVAGANGEQVSLIVEGAQTAAGTHTATAKISGVTGVQGLATNYTLTGDTKQYVITSADGFITLKESAGSMTFGTDTYEFEIDTHHGGELSAELEEGRATVNGTTVTVTGIGAVHAGETIAITVKSGATNNYNEATATYLLTVNAQGGAEFEIILPTDSYEYTGSQIAPVPTQVKVKGTNTVLTTDDFTLVYGDNLNVADGGTITAKGINDYFGSSGATTFKITTKKIALTAGTKSEVYNGTPLTFSDVEINGELAPGHTLSAPTTGSITDVGSVNNVISQPEIRISDANGNDVTANYTVTTFAGTLTVTKKPIAVEWGTQDSFVFDGSPKAPSVTTPVEGVNGEQINLTVDGAITNVGSSTAVAKILSVTNNGKATNYELTGATKPFSVTVANGFVNLVETEGTSTYGTAKHSFDIASTHGGKLTAEAEPVGSVSITDKTVTVNGLANVSAGEEITVTVTSAATDNYKAAIATYTIRVVANANAEFDVTLPATSYEYTGKQITPVPTEVKLSGTDKVLTDGKDFGVTYGNNTTVAEGGTVIVKGKGDYEGSETIINFTITAKKITLTAGTRSEVYNGTPLTFNEVTRTGDLAEGHTLDVDAVGSITNVGEEVNSVSVESIEILDENGRDVKANYDITTVDGKLTVTPKEITVTWGVQDSFEFDGTAKAPTVTTPVDGANGEKVNLVVKGAETNAGSYTATAEISSVTDGDAANYTLANATKAYSITQKAGYVTLSESSMTINYGTDSHSFEITDSHGGELSAKANIGSTTINDGVVTVSGLANISVGTTITVTVTSKATNNYTEGVATYEISIEEGAITGSVVITGTPRVGEVLVANTVNVMPAGATYAYKWFVSDSDSTEGGTEIEGATSRRFYITEEYIGKYIYVTVDATLEDYDSSTFKDSINSAIVAEGVDVEVESGDKDVVVQEFDINGEKVVVSIPDEVRVYKGTAYTPEVTITDDGVPLTASEFTATYADNVDVGTATITITGIGNYTGTRKLTFKIVEKEIVVEWGAQDSFVYDASDKAPSVTTPVDGVNGEIVHLEVEGAEVNVGDYTATAKILSVAGGDAKNYVLSGNTKAFKITKAKGFVNLKATEGEITYGTASHEFEIDTHHGGALSAESSHGTAEVNGNTVTVSGLANVSVTEEVTVTVTADATDNYKAASATYTIKVKPNASLEFEVILPASSYEYTGTAIKPTPIEVKIKGTNTVLEPGADYTLSYGNNTTVAEGGTVTAEGAGDYAGSDGTANFTITPKKITVTWVGTDSFTYDGEPKVPTVTTPVAGANGAEINLEVEGAITDVGTSTAIAKIESVTGDVAENYELTGNTKDFVVTQADGYVVLKETLGSMKYGTDEFTFEIDKTHGGSLSPESSVGTATIDGNTVTVTGLASVDVGTTIEITVKSEATNNYKEASATYTLTVKAQDGVEFEVILPYDSYEYQGSAIEPIPTQVKIKGTDTILGVGSYDVTYGNNTTVAEGGKVIVKGNAKGNYEGSEGTATFTITPKKIKLTAGSKSEVYNGTALTLNEVSCEGELAIGHSLSATTNGTITNVGEVDNVVAIALVTITDANGNDVKANYEIETVNGKLTVTPKEISVEWDIQDSFVYDSNPKAPSVTTPVAGANGEEVNLVVEGAITDVGTSTAVAKIESVTNGLVTNYVLSGDTKDFKVTQGEGFIDLVETEGEIIYGTETHEFEIERHHGGALNVVEITKGKAEIDGTTVKVSELSNVSANTVITVKVESAATTNYKAATATYTLTVKPQGDLEFEVILPETSYEYQGTAIEPIPTQVKIKGTDTILGSGDYEVIYGNNTNVAEGGSVTAKGIGDYEGSEGTTTFTITARKITLTAGTDTNVYNGTAFTLSTVTSEGELAIGHELSAQATGSITNVGEIENVVDISSVTITDADGNDVKANYEIETVNGKLTVTPKEIAVEWDIQDSFVYNSLAQAPSVVTPVAGVNGEQINLLVEGAITDVGNSTAVAKIESVTGGQATNYVLSGDTKDFEVTQADGYITLKETSGSITYGDETHEFEVDTHHGGKLEVTQISVGNADVDGTTVKVSGLSKVSANTVITVTVQSGATTNHKAAITTYTISVKAQGGLEFEVVLPQSSYTYEGTAIKPIPTEVKIKGTDTVLDSGDYKLSYGNNTTVAEGGTVMATGIGDYEGSSGAINFTITRRPIEITANSNSKPYDGSPLTDSGYSISGDLVSTHDIEVVITGSITFDGSVPNKVESVVITADGVDVTENYEVKTVDGTLTVVEANAIAGKVTIMGTPRVGESLLANTIGITPAGCTYEYQWYSSDVSATEGGEVIDGATDRRYIVTENMIGKYIYVVVNATRTGNTPKTFADVTNNAIVAAGQDVEVDSGDKDVIVEEHNISGDKVVISIPDEERIYNGAEHRPTVTVVDDGTPLYEWAEYRVDYEANIEAGTAKIIITGINTYKGTRELLFTISERPITIKPVDAEKPYDGKPLRSDTAELVDGSGSLVSGHEVVITTSGEITNVGVAESEITSAIVKDAAGKDVTKNYLISTEKGRLEVTAVAGEFVVELDEDTFIYDGTPKTPGVTVKVGGNAIDSSEYDVVPEGNVNAGTAKVIVTGKIGGNYEGSSGEATFTIEKRKLEIIANDGTKVFDGDPLTANGYKLSGDVADGQELNVVIKGTITNVGEVENVVESFTITSGGVSVADNYDVTLTNGKLKVTPWATDFTVELDEDNYTYDGTAKTPGVTVKVDGDAIDESEYEVKYEGNVNAGTAKVIVTGKLGKNYEGSRGEATFTISKLTIEIVADSATKPYDGEALTKDSYKLNGNVVAWHSLQVVIKGSITNVGRADNVIESFTITSGDENVAGNYDVTTTKGILEITAVAGEFTVELDEDNYTYDGTAKTPGVTVTMDGKAIDESEYEVKYEGNTNAGTAKVTVTGKIGKNYEGSYGEATFDIAKVKLVITADSKTETYDGNELTADGYTVSGDVVDGQELNVVISGSITNVGEVENVVESYTITSGDVDVADNYDVTTVNGKLKVTPADPKLDVKVEDKVTIVKGNSLEFTFTYSGDGVIVATSSDDKTMTITKDGNKFIIKGIEVGTEVATITLGAGTNHMGETFNIEVEVVKANYSVTKDGTTIYYNKLEDAVVNGGRVVVMNDVVDNSTNVVIDKTTTIDFSEYEISIDAPITIVTDGVLIINGGTGSALVNNEESAIINNGGGLIIGSADGTINDNPRIEGNSYAIEGGFTFNGGTLVGSNNPPYAGGTVTIERQFAEIVTELVDGKYESKLRTEGEGPVITVEQDELGKTNGNVTLTITVTDNLSGVKELTYTLDGVTQTLGFATVKAGNLEVVAELEVEENGIYKFTATDNAGNVGTLEHEVDNIDRDAANVTGVGIVGMATDNVITNTGVILNNIVVDSNDVDKVFFSNINSAPSNTSDGWVTYTSGVQVPWVLDNSNGNGEKTVYAWAMDDAGNISTIPYTLVVTLNTKLIGGNTNKVTLMIAGIDRNFSASTLELGHISFTTVDDVGTITGTLGVGDKSMSKDSLEYVDGTLRGPKYNISLTNVRGAGKIIVNVAANTLVDKAGNYNDAATLNTDIEVDTNAPEVKTDGGVLNVVDAEGNLLAVTINGKLVTGTGSNFGTLVSGDVIKAYDKAGNVFSYTY